MAIRHLQMGAAAARRVASTGGGGAESSPPPANESGYYVLGNNYADFSHINPYSSGYASANSAYMCSQNIDTFPDGIKKVGLYRNNCIYVLTSGNDLYALGEFHRGDNTEAKRYYQFTYVTGNVLDAFVSKHNTAVIDTGNTLFMCGENYGLGMHDALPATGTIGTLRERGNLISTRFREMPGSWTSVDTHLDRAQTFVGQQTDGKIYVWGRIAGNNIIPSPSGTSINDWSDYFLGNEQAIILKRSNGDLYGFGYPLHIVDSSTSNGDPCNRLGIGKALGTSHTTSRTDAFPIASVFNALNKNFTKVSVGERQSALLTDDKALYVIGQNYSAVFSNHHTFGYDFSNAPVFLYSGIEDVCLVNNMISSISSKAMIFISGGDLYGLGQADYLHNDNPHADLSSLIYLTPEDPGYGGTSQWLTYSHPILMETGNWKYCFFNDHHRIVWNDTELGIGGRCQMTEITPKSVRNNSYKDITFIPGVDASIFENIEFRTDMQIDNYHTRGYCAYLSGNEFYVWGRNNHGHLIYPPDSGNYYLFPDTLPTNYNVNVGDFVRRASLWSLHPKKVEGVWDKAFVYPNAVFLTANNSGYFFGDANNSNTPLGNAVSYSSNLKIRFESGIGKNLYTDTNNEVPLNADYIYPPEYLGYEILDVIWGDSYCILLTTDNKLYGCGYNKQGQLGLGNTTNQTTFQNATQFNGSGIVKIFGGQVDRPNLALSSGGDLYIWGPGGNGLGISLSNGNAGFVDNNVTDVFLGGVPDNSPPFRSIVTYYIKNSGELYALAENSNNYKGQILTGDTTGRNTWTRIGLDSDWAEISHPHSAANLTRDDDSFYLMAYNHTVLARKTDNSIYIATDDKFNNMNSGFQSLSTTDGLIHGLNSTEAYTSFLNNLRPINITPYSGIYASRIIGHSDGFILIPTG